MTLPKLPLVSLHLFILFAIVLGTELELLSWVESGQESTPSTNLGPLLITTSNPTGPELITPSNPGPLLITPSNPGPLPKPHHHFHQKTAQAPVQQPPVKPLPPVQVPAVKPLPPVHAPVKPLPPSQAPVKPVPPVRAPVKPVPPVRAPVKPVPKRSLVAVQGVVYCKSCKFSGTDTLLGATPLLGANVELHCNNTKFPKVQLTKTDKNGYFFMLAQNSLTTFGAHKCQVKLGSSSDPKCSKPTNLHYGLQGSKLLPQKQPNLPKALPYQLYSVGPFAYEPAINCAP